MKNQSKIFLLATFHINLQNQCVLESINKMDLLEFMIELDRYLLLFGPEKYYVICDRTIYLIILESSFSYVISHNYERMKIDSYDSLILQKKIFLLYVKILIKSVFNTDKNYYYCNNFLKKCFCLVAKT